MRNNKILSLLRSMKFGMILLTVIAALSVVGTLIVQGQSVEFYEQMYGKLGKLITMVGADHMYSVWYYVMLFAMLCVNLSLCSVLRLGKIKGMKTALIARAKMAKPELELDAEAVKTIASKIGFRKTEEDVYVRRGWGLYGSFATHLGMLLLVIASSCVFSLEKKEEIYLLVGDAMTLSDGSSITINGFSLENERGQLDYISDLTILDTTGKETHTTITVNNPVRFDDHTVYQQSYAFAGVLDIQTDENAPAEQAVLDAPAFISLDGVRGVYYMQVYGNHTVSEDGQIVPAAAAGMENPAYVAIIVNGENQEMKMILPDEVFEVGGVYYTFREPAAYPGLLIKTQPLWVTPLLYTAFVILVAGLYLCFFHIPSAMCLQDGSVRVAEGKGSHELVQQMKDMLDDMNTNKV